MNSRVLLFSVLINVFVPFTAKKIAIIYDVNDRVVQPLVEALNISLMFYKDVYQIKSVIETSVRSVSGNFVDESLYSDADFVVSLLNNGDLIASLAEKTQQADLPTIQTRLFQWEGVNRVGQNDTTSAQNYAVMVPSFVVFDNMLDDMMQALDITTNVTVIYDENYQNLMEYDWQRPFLTLNVSVDFQTAKMTPELITEHLNRLERTTKVLMFITNTMVVEKYVRTGQKQIEENLWTWIVFTKDTLVFKCVGCENVQIHWVRVVKSTPTKELAKFANFVWLEELENQFVYSRETKHHLQMSYCLDIIWTALSMLQGYNETTDDIVQQESTVDWHDQNTTLQGLLRRFKEFDFGTYEFHSNNVFYQVHLTSEQIKAVDIRIDRMSRFPHSKFAKLIANWTFSEGLQPLFDGINVNVRKLTHYRIVTILQEPFIELGGPPETFGFQGVCIDLIEMVSKELNFTYELYLVPDGKFGSMEQTGNWNGMIGQLVSGEADIALGPISQISEREVDVDFTTSFYGLVLDWPVWVCIVGAYLFTSLLLWTFDRFSPYSYTNNREKYKDDNEKREFTLRECFWFCMTSLTPQGGGEAPKNLSGRLVAATWWLFGFIIIASYTANLAAFLTVSRTDQQINGLDDLAKQYKIRYAPLKDGATETYFKRMAEIEEQFYNIWKQMSLNESISSAERAQLAVWDYPVSDKYTNMWRFMQESQLPENAEAAIARVMEESNRFAFIGDAKLVKYATFTNCKLQQIGQEFSRKPYALAVQKDSRLKNEISTSIAGLLNARTLETQKEKWWHQNPKRLECLNNEEESTGISINNIGGVFILILGCIIISLTMLVVEFFYYKRQEKKNEGLQISRRKDDVRVHAFTIPNDHRIHPTDSLGSRSLPSSNISETTASVNGIRDDENQITHRDLTNMASHQF
ncbi:Protein CBR-GLR-7 [Aphelenchoides besseyi]|nr:Protein CBR-GLR-7 [Aphelenchoides besseyi]